MKAESISTIRKEVQSLDRDEILAILIKLIRYSTINKELTSYLLYYAQFDDLFVGEVNKEIASSFSEIHTRSAFIAKKSIRKTVRILNKYVRFSSSKNVEIEIRLFFCRQFLHGYFHILNDDPLLNIYLREVEKIKKAISALHEDLQSDYMLEIDQLNEQRRK